MSIKSAIKKFIPPIFLDVRKLINLKDSLYYFGNFETWEDALKESHRLGGDYEDKNIIDQVDDAVQKVRRGEAVYEQDGVCFYEKNNNWELLAALFYIKSKIQNISVLDFGGALGSTYFRYKDLIDELKINWSIVEQKNFVDRGRKTVPEIPFYYNIDEALNSDFTPQNILLLSGVLMYLDKPYEMLRDMLNKNFQYVIIDENAFFVNENSDESIMLQHVPPSIYKAVYPAYIFGLKKFREFIINCGYEIIFEWTFSGQIPIKKKFGLQDTIDKGFLLRKNGDKI